ncbi:hypothetical protein SBRCBS47491_001823 [Sporothrix bragantina]|uniref:Carboxylic ester hydrolase n=1 Tax=Sporothrix bragantina TaxID=671064 RepID=A0ABP0B1W7_9PEZI
MTSGKLLQALLALPFLGIPSVFALSHDVINRRAVPTVTIQNGSISGIQLGSYAQEGFFGIPYANNPPPRFGRATRHNGSLDGFQATAYSEFCPGFGGDDIYLYGQGYKAGESCLTLNIVRPSGYDKGANLPVGVWIYGGGFSNGGSPDHRYNTTWVVDRSVQMNRPILTVTLNYRVSFFGFPNGQEVVDAHAQNLGLYDQQLALQWIQENIAAFGGDPAKVTIWGQSAGSQSVAYHILGQGGSTGSSLFRGGIMESGAASWNPMYTAGQAQAAFDAIVGNTSCANASSSSNSSVLGCLSSIPFAELNASVAMSTATWQPNVDGDILQDYPSKLLAAGKVAPVTIMHGCNTDDSSQAAPKGTNVTKDVSDRLFKSWPNITTDVDVAYVFSNPLPTQNPLGDRPGDAELAKLMTSMWVSFINDLTPNNHQINDTVHWPSYNRRAQDFVFQRFDPYVEVDDYRSAQIDYINSIGQYLSH